jgi:hypothetical protein
MKRIKEEVQFEATDVELSAMYEPELPKEDSSSGMQGAGKYLCLRFMKDVWV